MYQSLWQEILKHQNVLLHLHVGPDGDSVGSNLALYLALKSLKKNVTLISGDSPYPGNLSCFPESENITKANIFDIDLTDYDCLLSLDTSDLPQITRKGDIIFPKNLTVIVIDHHPTNTKFGNLNFVKPNLASTSEIIFNLLTKNKVKITAPMAACLFGGIYTDTGGLKYSLVNSKTFAAATVLTKIYPNFTKLIFDLENNDRPERLAVKSVYLKQIKTFNHLAISWINLRQYQHYFSEEDTSISGEIANNLKSVIGWEIAICLTEIGKNQTKASFRTRDPQRYPVGPLALATGFGGGHLGAAGASFPFALTKTINLIKSTVKKIYPDIL